MHRVVPELIVEKYRRGEFNGEFQAAGLFLDLSGFSSMTDELMQHGQHGAEVLAILMHGVFDPLVENIFSHGGKIVSFAGDGIMALFPLNGDEKSIALHALTAAWTIQRALLSNPERQTVYGDFTFSVKIGMTLGSVSWGILRSTDGGKATYYFRGSAVDDSAAAEHAAEAGQIIVTESIWALLRDEIQTSPNESFHRLDGFRFEMPAAIPVSFPPVDLQVSRLFMPEEVITQDIRGEFRQIVNLFIRFPDLSYQQLQKLTQVVFELHEKYGGLVNRLDFGDKGCNMLSLWGAPVAYENDMARALNFVLELKARVPFPVTAGVTYFVAHAGYLGSSMCEDYTCYGWGVNLASRFMMSAPQGGIWIDERIARRVKNRFDFEPRGAQLFKGFAAEQKVFALSGRKAQEILFQGEFVGREVELPLLVDCIQPLWQGRFAGLVSILGDAGIGKSRLVYELKESLSHQGRDVLWALCHSDQILRHSFNPIRYWLLQYFGIDPGTDEAARKLAFEEKMNRLIECTSDSELSGDLHRLRSVLGSLVDLHWPDSFYEQLDAEGRHNNTLNSIIILIKAESLRQPVIIFIEDAQFIDEETKAFLPRLRNALSAAGREYPAAILVSSRRSGLALFPEEQTVELGPLSQQALFELTEMYLGGAPSPDLVKLVKVRSEGNPYFVEQFLIYMQEENLLEMSRKGWQATRRLNDSSLPADIRALLVARLDQLPRNVRDVIQTAAVLGREFDVQILSEMLKGGGDLSDDLLEAEQASIWSALNPHRYSFTHGLLRDAAYAMQMRARRIELHISALEALETTLRVGLDAHFGELAHHAERARLARKALYYLRLAGKAAADEYQNSAAVDYYTRALAFVPEDDPVTRYDIAAERLDMYTRMGKRDLQLRELDLLEKWARALDDTPRLLKALRLRASYHYLMGNYMESVDYAKRAQVVSSVSMEADETRKALLILSLSLHRLGRFGEAMRQAKTLLGQVGVSNDRREQGQILSVMGLIALDQKEPANAVKYIVEALEIAREVKDRSLEVVSLNNLALAEGSVNGNYAVARTYYEQSYMISREIGDRNAESFTLGNLGFAAGMQGDFDAARSYHEQSLLAAREIGNRYHEIYILINLSAVLGNQGEAEDALQHAQQAIDLAQKHSDRTGEAWAWLYLGHAHLLRDELQEANAAYDKSIGIRRELGQPALAMEPLAGLVQSHMKANDLASASREVDHIMAYLDAGSTLDGTDEPLRVYYACYEFLEKTKDPRASLILKDAIRVLEAQVSKFSDEASRRRYVENIPWRRAIREASFAG